MRERDMTVLFGKYIRSVKPKKSAVFELKICKKGALPFNAVKDHQIAALQAASETGLYHKLTDQPWLKDRPNSFTFQKPFDAIYLINIEAFIVIWWYHPNKPKEFIFIPISTFLDERDNSERKSLTEVKAKMIGNVITITF